MAFLFVQLLYNFRHNLLISPNGLERLIASEIEIKKHVAKVAEMAEVSATSATSAMLRICERSIDFQEENSKKWISADF